MSSPRAYYNEHDEKAAAWLRELIKQGLVMDGEVDTRSIADVEPTDLVGFTRCHFFAGIGGWDYAMRLAGWPVERPVWTGSCPCQPFSAAGRQEGHADARHLWPVWERLIRECRPATVFGEQVASAIGHGWLDLVGDDLEREGYAFGSAVLPAGGIGAPHKRDRLWFVADAQRGGFSGRNLGRLGTARSEVREHEDGPGVADELSDDGQDVGRVADRAISRWREERPHGRGCRTRDEAEGRAARFESDGASGRVADAGEGGREVVGSPRLHDHGQRGDDAARRSADGGMGDARRARGQAWFPEPAPRQGGNAEAAHDRGGRAPRTGHGPENFWSDCDWIPCRDGKWRPVGPGTFPLAHGVPARVVRLRGYGNAIVPQVAAEVIAAFMEAA